MCSPFFFFFVGTTDQAWVFSHRMQTSHCKKQPWHFSHWEQWYQPMTVTVWNGHKQLTPKLSCSHIHPVLLSHYSAYLCLWQKRNHEGNHPGLTVTQHEGQSDFQWHSQITQRWTQKSSQGFHDQPLQTPHWNHQQYHISTHSSFGTKHTPTPPEPGRLLSNLNISNRKNW